MNARALNHKDFALSSLADIVFEIRLSFAFVCGKYVTIESRTYNTSNYHAIL